VSGRQLGGHPSGLSGATEAGPRNRAGMTWNSPASRKGRGHVGPRNVLCAADQKLPESGLWTLLTGGRLGRGRQVARGRVCPRRSGRPGCRPGGCRRSWPPGGRQEVGAGEAVKGQGVEIGPQGRSCADSVARSAPGPLVLLCHKTILPQGDHTTGSEEGTSQESAPGAISGSQWKRGYDAQAVGDPRGRKSLGTLAGRRKARGAGGESRARSAARNA
jgi:hypothetical protein